MLKCCKCEEILEIKYSKNEAGYAVAKYTCSCGLATPSMSQNEPEEQLPDLDFDSMYDIFENFYD